MDSNPPFSFSGRKASRIPETVNCILAFVLHKRGHGELKRLHSGRQSCIMGNPLSNMQQLSAYNIWAIFAYNSTICFSATLTTSDIQFFFLMEGCAVFVVLIWRALAPISLTKQISTESESRFKRLPKPFYFRRYLCFSRGFRTGLLHPKS